MEEDPAPPPGGATESKNPNEKPLASQMDSENTSDPLSKTPTLAELQAPTEGFSFFNTPTPDPTQNPLTPSQTTSIYLNPQEGWDGAPKTDWDGNPIPTSTPKPPPSHPNPTQNPEEILDAAELEEDLMQDIRTAEVQQEEQAELTILARLTQTQKPKVPESPTTRVSSGTWGPLPKITRGNIEKPAIKNPGAQNTSTPEPMVTQGPPTPGTKEGTPHLVTPQLKDSPPKNTSYADRVKGGKTIQESPFQQTVCEINDDEASVRVPPPTDVTYSVWIDLSKLKLSHSVVKRMAEKHHNIKGAGLRKEAQWLECYCGSRKDVEFLLTNPMTYEENRIEFIKARKLFGDKLVIKLANVNPSPGEEITRAALTKALGTVAQVERVEPVYLKPEPDAPKEDWLCTRRWNALVYVPEGTKFMVVPHFDLFNTTIIMTWKGSRCSVCHICKEMGHWSDQCSPTLRAIAQQKKQKKLDPALLPEKTPSKESVQGTAEKPAEKTVQKTAEKPAEKGSTSKDPKTADPKPVNPQTKQPIKQEKQPKATQPKEQTKGSSSKKSSTEKEMEAIEASKQALAEEGFYTISSGDEVPKKEDPKKKEEAKRPYSANRQVRTLTTTSVTTRPRTIGTLTDYAYYLLKIGSATVQEATDMLARIKPQEFIETTKPGMSKQLYANFTKFVGRRKAEGADVIQELKEYKVSVPEILIPRNDKYIDTSVAAKKTERKKKRKKAESTTTAESLPEERNELAQPLTRAVIQYIDEAGKEASFRIKFTQNMRINTLAKSICKKRKIEGNFQLLRSDDSPLDFEKTAMEVGLKDEEKLTINMEFAQEDQMEEDTDEIRIQFLPKGSSTVKTLKVPPQTSTTSIYMQIAEQTGKKPNDFTLYRGDGTPLNRYSEAGFLQFREFKVLRQELEETIPMEIQWIDNQKQLQHKPSHIPHSQSPAQADWHIRHELGLEFEYEFIAEDLNVKDFPTMATLNEEMMSNRLCLKRPNQSSWDDREFQEKIGIARLIVKHSATSNECFSFPIAEHKLIVDVLEEIAKQNPEFAGRHILDNSGIQYDLDINLYLGILPGVTIEAYISTKNNYTKEEITKAINKIALDEEMSVEVIAQERFPHLITPL